MGLTMAPALSPEDDEFLARLIASNGLGQLQAPAPTTAPLGPEPGLLPPGQFQRAPQSAPPMDLGAMASAGPAQAPAAPPMPAAPMPPQGVSPAQPAGAVPAMMGLFADKDEIKARLADMFDGWAMGAGGTWQDSLAAGGKAVAIGKLTRKEKKELAASDNKTRAYAVANGIDGATADAWIAAGQGKGLLNLVEENKRAMAGGQVDPIEINGQLVDRYTGAVIGDYRDQGGAGFRILTAEDKASMGLPAEGAFQVDGQGKISAIGGGGITINNGGSDKGMEAGLKGFGEQMGAFMSAGVETPMNLARIDRLEAVLNGAPQGMEGGIKQFAGEFGINTEGLDNIQAAQSILNSMVPAQRLPGSGPMSDADLALFKQSIPRIINQPGGNALIIDTLRSVEKYKAAYAEIAAQYVTGQLTPQQVLDAQEALPNPFAKLTNAMNAGNTAQSDLKKKYGLE